MRAKSNQSQGVVYFIQSGGSGLVKIGFTTSLKKRVNGLTAMSATPLTVLRSIAGTMPLERAFHRMFDAQRVRGEWFHYTEEMLSGVPEDRHYRSVLESGADDRNGERYVVSVSRFLQEKYSKYRDARAIIAGLSESTENTARNWMAGACGPNGDSLIALAAADEEFERLIVGLIRTKRLHRQTHTKPKTKTLGQGSFL